MFGDMFDVTEYCYEAGQNARADNPCEWTRAEAWECFLESHDADISSYVNSNAARQAFRDGWEGV